MNRTFVSLASILGLAIMLGACTPATETTPAPGTAAPDASPTMAPTASPTVSPTVSPTP